MSQEFELIQSVSVKLDSVYDGLSDIRAELVAIKVDLNFHIHRTNLLEEQVKSMDRHITKLQGFFAIGGWILGIAATVLTVMSQLGIL